MLTYLLCVSLLYTLMFVTIPVILVKKKYVSLILTRFTSILPMTSTYS